MTTVATSYWPADTSEPVLETTVGGILRAAATAGLDMLAMVGGVPDPGQRRRWTYAELLAEAEQAARALTTRFAPGERVAVWAPNLPEWVILEYAAGLAGLVLVTVNPALRPAELAYVLNQSGAVGIFLVPEFRSPMAQFLAEVRPDIPALREVIFFTDWAEFLGTAPANAVLPEVGAGRCQSGRRVSCAPAGTWSCAGITTPPRPPRRPSMSRGGITPGIWRPWTAVATCGSRAGSRT